MLTRGLLLILYASEYVETALLCHLFVFCLDIYAIDSTLAGLSSHERVKDETVSSCRGQTQVGTRKSSVYAT
jgi:hypothetical protein